MTSIETFGTSFRPIAAAPPDLKRFGSSRHGEMFDSPGWLEPVGGWVYCVADDEIHTGEVSTYRDQSGRLASVADTAEL